MERKEKISRLDYHADKILPVLLAAVEYLAILAAQKLSLVIQNSLPYKTGVFYLPDLYFYAVIPVIFLFFIFYNRVNERFIFFGETMQRTFYAVLYSEIFCVTAMYLFKASNYVSRAYIVIFFFMALLFLYLGRCILVKICRKLDILKMPVLFIGCGRTTESIIRFADTNNCFGIKVAGIVDDKPESEVLQKSYPVYKDMEKIEQYITDLKVQTVIIAIPSMEKAKLSALINKIHPLVRNLMFVPNAIGIPVFSVDVKKLYKSSMLLLGLKNNLAKKHNRMIKRIFDLLLGIPIFIFSLPILLLLAIWIKLDSKGPVCFNAERIGQNGKIFTCYKFRSMHMNSDEILKKYLAENAEAKEQWDTYQKLKDFDPRVTRAGRWLRRFSLDELPQILNVIKGDMSLVGPRPYLPREKELMDKYFSIITMTVPGVTGYWQVNGRSNVSFEGRLEMDDWYVRNWSIWLDLTLLAQTFRAVFSAEGAT